MQDNRIKVLQIVGNARLGGVAVCLLNYFRRTDIRRFRFDFVTYGPSPFDERIREIDPTSKIYSVVPFQKNPMRALSQLKDICKSDDYAVAHSHLTTLSAFALAAAAQAKTPVRVCHAHSAFDKNSEHFLIKSVLRPFAANSATHLMACSRHAAENIFGRRADEAVILPNAIEVEDFLSSPEQYSAAREELGVSGKVVLFVGRFAYQKDLPFLVRAFAQASRERDMTLVLLGEGEEEAAVLEEAAACGVTERLRIVPPCHPAQWYRAADVFCLPSRYEGLGMVAIEAQAAGLRCLLSTAVPKEADVTGRCAFLPKIEEIWAEAIVAAADHSYDSRDALIETNYDISREASRLTDFYEKAIRQAR